MINRLQIFSILACGFLVFGCSSHEENPIILPTPTKASRPTATPTKTNQPTEIASTTPTTPDYTNLVFYGDSSLAIGDAGDGIDHVGYSFVTDLKEMLDPIQILITANYGGRTAKWAFEHLEEHVYSKDPDVLTLWWGLNDLGGCPGFFDRETNRFLEYKLNTIVDAHITSLSQMIDSALAKNIPIFVLTPIPALMGKLPWSHFDEKSQIVWETDRWCNFIQGEDTLAQAQRDLVSDYSSLGEPVFLVDVWQVYMDNPDKDKMYIDVVHPASTGAKLIAEEWYRVYQEMIK